LLSFSLFEKIRSKVEKIPKFKESEPLKLWMEIYFYYTKIQIAYADSDLAKVFQIQRQNYNYVKKVNYFLTKDPLLSI